MLFFCVVQQVELALEAALHKNIGSAKTLLGGLEPPSFRLTVERANQLRHRSCWRQSCQTAELAQSAERESHNLKVGSSSLPLRKPFFLHHCPSGLFLLFAAASVEQSEAGHVVLYLVRGSLLDPGLRTCVFMQTAGFPSQPPPSSMKNTHCEEEEEEKKKSTTTGFEPVQAEPN